MLLEQNVFHQFACQKVGPNMTTLCDTTKMLRWSLRFVMFFLRHPIATA